MEEFDIIVLILRVWCIFVFLFVIFVFGLPTFYNYIVYNYLINHNCVRQFPNYNNLTDTQIDKVYYNSSGYDQFSAVVKSCIYKVRK